MPLHVFNSNKCYFYGLNIFKFSAFAIYKQSRYRSKCLFFILKKDNNDKTEYTFLHKNIPFLGRYFFAFFSISVFYFHDKAYSFQNKTKSFENVKNKTFYCNLLCFTLQYISFYTLKHKVLAPKLLSIARYLCFYRKEQNRNAKHIGFVCKGCFTPCFFFVFMNETSVKA